MRFRGLKHGIELGTPWQNFSGHGDLFFNRDGSLLFTPGLTPKILNGIRVSEVESGRLRHTVDGRHRVDTLDAADLFDASVAGLGDLDRDGIPDLAVGARFDDVDELERTGGDEGAVYATMLASQFVSTLSPFLLASLSPMPLRPRNY